MNAGLKPSKGFTIVELLVVIVVIGLLAAITIVAFNGVQRRANESVATNMASSAKHQLLAYQTTNGAFPVAANLADAGVVSTEGTNYQYTTTTDGFCLTATKGQSSVKITESTTPSAGGCSGHGQGGTSAVTNLAPNPSFEVNNGWYSNNGSLYPRSVSSTIKRSGSYAVESHNLSSSTSLLSLYAPGANDGAGFAAEPNKTYTASVYFRSDVPHQGRIGISYRSGGTYQTTSYSPYVTGTVGEWTRVSYTATSPSGTDLTRLIVVVNALSTQPANTSAWADDVMMTEGSSSPGYADGGTTDWVWNGTPHSATSTGPAL